MEVFVIPGKGSLSKLTLCCACLESQARSLCGSHVTIKSHTTYRHKSNAWGRQRGWAILLPKSSSAPSHKYLCTTCFQPSIPICPPLLWSVRAACFQLRHKVWVWECVQWQFVVPASSAPACLDYEVKQMSSVSRKHIWWKKSMWSDLKQPYTRRDWCGGFFTANGSGFYFKPVFFTLKILLQKI